MKYQVKIGSHEQACKETAQWLGKSRYVTLRTELSKCRTAKECLKYSYMAGGLAGFSGRAVIHALVREAMAHRKIMQQASDLLVEGTANAKPSCKRNFSCNNTCPEAAPCDKGKEQQMAADKLVKSLLSVKPLFSK